MFDLDMYTTPEGFELSRPLLLPDARSFSDVLEYLGEWKPEYSHRSGRREEEPPGVRYLSTRETALGGTMGALLEMGGMSRDTDAVNEIGPYCSVDLSQLGGPRSRSMAVRATDAVLDAVRPRIVTDDDHLSFELIAHADRNRVLVILKHGHISGSHWLAYIDPDTIPAYPFAARDSR
jgi:hypothetical protein